jgi:hypothetical protein
MPGPPENLLANSNWQLQACRSRLHPGEVSIAYFSADGSLSGNGGCNAYNASYASNGQEILINKPSGGGSPAVNHSTAWNRPTWGRCHSCALYDERQIDTSK